MNLNQNISSIHEKGTHVTLPKGLIGFPQLKHFKIKSLFPDAKESLFWQLISEEAEDLSFVLMGIDVFGVKKLPYGIHLDPQDIIDSIKELGISEKEISCFFIVSILSPLEDGIQKMTLNLRAPLIYHPQTSQGWQVILANREYSLSFLIS